MNRTELVNELRATGYDGPISFSKSRLEELLAEQQHVPEPTVAPEGIGAPAPSEQPLTAKPRGKNRPKVLSESPFTREYEWETLSPDFDFQVRSERGWFHFIAKATNPETGEWWIDAYGGDGKHQMFRSFRPSRIKRRAHNGAIVQRKSRHDKESE